VTGREFSKYGKKKKVSRMPEVVWMCRGGNGAKQKKKESRECDGWWQYRQLTSVKKKKAGRPAGKTD